MFTSDTMSMLAMSMFIPTATGAPKKIIKIKKLNPN